VRPLTSEDKADLAAFPFDEEAEFQALGGALPVGEKGFTTLERRYAYVSLYNCITGLSSQWHLHTGLNPPVTHSLTHSLTHSITHSLILSLLHSMVCTICGVLCNFFDAATVPSPKQPIDAHIAAHSMHVKPSSQENATSALFQGLTS